MDAQAWLLAASGPLTAVIFGAIQRLSRAQAKDAAKEQFAEQIRAELAVFKQDLLASINGTYRRRGECELIEHDSERRLALIEEQVKDLHSYAHSRAHQLANDIQRMGARQSA